MAFSEAVYFSLELSGMPLKEEELSAIEAVYEGRNVFVCLPTGYGKRLCYQTLPFVMEHNLGGDGAVIIVSILSSSSSVSKDDRVPLQR